MSAWFTDSAPQHDRPQARARGSSSRAVRRTAAALLLTAASSGAARATIYDFSLSGPTTLPGGIEAQVGSVVSHDTGGGPYAIVLELPPGTPIQGLERVSGSQWLFSFDAPVVLGGALWEPRDVVRYDADTGEFTCFLSGSALGIPADSGIDALYLPAGDSGPLVVSFDLPTILGAVQYLSRDLVQLDPTGTACSGWSVGAIVFDSARVPAGGNLVAAAGLPGALALSFDVAVSFPFEPSMPGDLARWVGDNFTLWYRDPAWPAGVTLNDVAIELWAAGGPTTLHVRQIRGACTAGFIGARCSSDVDCGEGGLCTMTASTDDDVTALTWDPPGPHPVDLYTGTLSDTDKGSLFLTQSPDSGAWYPPSSTACFAGNLTAGALMIAVAAVPDPAPGSGVFYLLARDLGAGGAPNASSFGCANPAVCSNRGWCELGAFAGRPCDHDGVCLPGGHCRLMKTNCWTDTGPGEGGGCARHPACVGGTENGRLCNPGAGCAGGTCSTVPPDALGPGVCFSLPGGYIDVEGCPALGVDPQHMEAILPAAVVSACP